MATQAHPKSRRSGNRRVRRIAKTVAGHWLLVLASHTLATAVVIALAAVLKVPECGGR
jgi:hypothetical protein